MKKLFLIANKLPLQVNDIDGKKELEPVLDGLDSGLKGFYESFDIKWIGRAGVNIDEISENEKIDLDNKFRKDNCIPIYLDQELRSAFLEGFCDNTIWPLFNYFTQNTKYYPANWEAYKKVNQLYFEVISKYINDDDILWVHDYHLMLLPKLIREKFPNVSIGYFQHIPFPSFEIFRFLPWRIELLEGILGADLIGFHTYDYQRHFMSCVRRLLGNETVFNRIRLDERIVKVDAFPMGIDFEYFNNTARELAKSTAKEESEIHKELKEYLKRAKNQKIILSIDRLDYTKGIPDRIKAFELFLNTYPEYLEKVTLFLFVTPSRENITDYQDLKKQLDELVGRINGGYGSIGWMPIWYFYRATDRMESIELYNSADIALITPTRDGMNLPAKEYLACKTDNTGVLILSEMAGAAKELGESIIVNPNNRTEVAGAIYQALNMSVPEQIKRNSALQKRLKIYNEERWANDFINGLESVKKLQESNYTRKVNNRIIDKLVNAYNIAKKRIIFLDYDGTLTGFHKDPQMAMPDAELYSIVKKLTNVIKNTVVIISGRDKETLSKWFIQNEKLAFIAEHGVWNKNPGEEWEMTDQIEKEWMGIIEPVLQSFVDRTPRSFIEFKNYSLVWHYRDADPDMGQQRAWELKEDLKNYIANLNLEIMDGDKVIEIKNAGINKGKAALNKIGNVEFDFILALGDDWTDEYTFNSLPESAITIKVGTKTTAAKYYINDVKGVRNLLQQLEIE
ncbi:MAG: bifunctional alpha,alpha-trehalose-phosphate synthase (UDP-forming)/trehalose-phosphatase [Prolixibacteraceae bacterium]|jgi:trehalose 6-phosphate synthase/phosphatase|nr:bifunctional alpha,alpha-trehalose-phosphate synthase (UDP-forming)/trehalose-phosphatase [Prolixibacteraceae bacterium]MBT6766043.1 bifunctional alpha,alpha-trehalose-phosphate synthase (UDP-forming)/trehalose-phosphatase [Prolixibacteraceae bacterium]MBT6998443.1 bifunctional alpha,alpha-trehalose-phosphate synthase (UDP-forming)/trehalose-phosphatase [Prolixibacteraceae bacterium]MBT7397274.1 bifunctional alpha,alpha-trehalose-phosphate synthase (UDP-forming)/trehalose-phosphatase [Prolixi